MLGELRPAARYLSGLRRFVRTPLGPDAAADVVERARADRERSFLRVLERGVFGNPRSVYRRLLGHAGIEHADVARLVGDLGLEGALERLLEAGVHVTLDEFKGRRPVVRPGLELPVAERDFDNPLLTRHYEARTGGSRSAGRRIAIDLDLIAHEAAHHELFLRANGLEGRPLAAWHAVPPGAAALKCLLYEARLGRSAARWFTQVGSPAPKYRAFTRATLLAARALGRPLPAPVHAPPDDPAPVVEWLAAQVAAGTPAVVSTNPSSAARACLLAARRGTDLSGTAFLLGGEPVTAAKAAPVEAAGCRVVPVYAMAELGLLGIGCPHSGKPDEVHLFTDKVALVRAGKAFHLTSLLPSCPKLMLNVETGDEGVVARRPCECAFGRAGLELRAHSIRSYEKLTSEGTTFLGVDLLRLVEETLPARFGGGPADYQLVERERDGRTAVSVVVSPAVGRVDEAELVGTVLRALAADDGTRQMARVWEGGGTLEVERREPYTTPTAGKIQPLHAGGPR